MSQNDDQRNRQGEEGYQDANSDQLTREGRGDRSQDSGKQEQNRGSSRQDQGSDLEDTDEMDEDRDDDQRSSGGQNRRNNIS